MSTPVSDARLIARLALLAEAGSITPSQYDALTRAPSARLERFAEARAKYTRFVDGPALRARAEAIDMAEDGERPHRLRVRLDRVRDTERGARAWEHGIEGMDPEDAEIARRMARETREGGEMMRRKLRAQYGDLADDHAEREPPPRVSARVREVYKQVADGENDLQRRRGARRAGDVDVGTRHAADDLGLTREERRALAVPRARGGEPQNPAPMQPYGESAYAERDEELDEIERGFRRREQEGGEYIDVEFDPGEHEDTPPQGRTSGFARSPGASLAASPPPEPTGPYRVRTRGAGLRALRRQMRPRDHAEGGHPGRDDLDREISRRERLAVRHRGGGEESHAVEAAWAATLDHLARAAAALRARRSAQYGDSYAEQDVFTGGVRQRRSSRDRILARQAAAAAMFDEDDDAYEELRRRAAGLETGFHYGLQSGDRVAPEGRSKESIDAEIATSNRRRGRDEARFGYGRHGAADAAARLERWRGGELPDDEYAERTEDDDLRFHARVAQMQADDYGRHEGRENLPQGGRNYARQQSGEAAERAEDLRNRAHAALRRRVLGHAERTGNDADNYSGSYRLHSSDLEERATRAEENGDIAEARRLRQQSRQAERMSKSGSDILGRHHAEDDRRDADDEYDALPPAERRRLEYEAWQRSTQRRQRDAGRYTSRFGPTDSKHNLPGVYDEDDGDDDRPLTPQERHLLNLEAVQRRWDRRGWGDPGAATADPRERDKHNDRPVAGYAGHAEGDDDDRAMTDEERREESEYRRRRAGERDTLAGAYPAGSVSGDWVRGQRGKHNDRPQPGGEYAEGDDDEDDDRPLTPEERREVVRAAVSDRYRRQWTGGPRGQRERDKNNDDPRGYDETFEGIHPRREGGQWTAGADRRGRDPEDDEEDDEDLFTPRATTGEIGDAPDERHARPLPEPEQAAQYAGRGVEAAMILAAQASRDGSRQNADMAAALALSRVEAAKASLEAAGVSGGPIEILDGLGREAARHARAVAAGTSTPADRDALRQLAGEADGAVKAALEARGGDAAEGHAEFGDEMRARAEDRERIARLWDDPKGLGGPIPGTVRDHRSMSKRESMRHLGEADEARRLADEDDRIAGGS